MENVNFQPSGEEIERALMDLGPLLGVTIKEEVPDELSDAASASAPPSRLNVSGAEGAEGEAGVEGAEGGKEGEGADSLASPGGARSPAAARCELCRAPLAAQDGTPKLMECLHSACEPCINAKLEERQANSRDFLGAERITITCPSCRLQCQVANMIDQRFVLEKMTADQAGSTGVTGEQQCNSCEDTEPATSYCVDCAEFICDNCVNAHQRLKITKDHTIKSKEEALAELLAAQGPRAAHDMYCRDHVQERLALFCETCDRLTCRDCQLHHHRDHKYQFSTEMAAQARANISSLLSEVSYKRVLLGSAMKVIRDRQQLIADKKRALVHDITQTVVKLTNAINTRGKQLVLRLNEVCDGKQRTLAEKKDALEQLAAITDHCVRFVTAALDQGSDTAVLYSKRAVCAHLQRIKSRRADIPNPEIPVRISLALDKLPDLVRVLSGIGAIVVDGKVDGAGGAQGPYHPPAAPAPAPAHSAVVALQHVAMHQSYVQGVQGAGAGTAGAGAGYAALTGRGARPHTHPHVTSTTHPHHLHGMSELNLRGLLNAQASRARTPHHAAHAAMQHAYHHSGEAGPSACAAAAAAGPAQDYKITLGRARAGAAHAPAAVTSTNPKTPSPSLNGVGGGGALELDKVCAESVQDLMATIAKLDSNGVQVVPEAPPRASPAPPVHSSTDPDPRLGKAGEPMGGGDPNEDWCAVCMDGGELMCCDKCPKVFHQYCHIPTIEKLPDETESWQCLLCVNFAELPADAEAEAEAGAGGGLSARTQRLVERLTLELYCQYEPSLPFREPVPADNTHYHAKVPRPVCLDMIRMKLQPRSPQRYTHVTQFLADVRLLFHNATSYNPPESSIYKDAKRLEEFFEAQLVKWLPEYAGAGAAAPAGLAPAALAPAALAPAALAPAPAGPAWAELGPPHKRPRPDQRC